MIFSLSSQGWKKLLGCHPEWPRFSVKKANVFVCESIQRFDVIVYHHYGSFYLRGDAIYQKDLFRMPLCTEMLPLVKSTKSNAVCPLLAQTPSITIRTIRIWKRFIYFSEIPKAIRIFSAHRHYFRLYSFKKHCVGNFCCNGVKCDFLPVLYLSLERKYAFQLSMNSPLFVVYWIRK